MREWIVAVPIWGERYYSTFLRWCWPSWQVALAPISDRVRIILFTDAADLARKMQPFSVEVRPVPCGATAHEKFAAAHRHALEIAEYGMAVALQNADHIISNDAYLACERRFDQGFKAVVCAGTRTVGPLFNEPVPVDIGPADLLSWAMLRAHPIIQQSMYPDGKGAVPSVMYFSDGKNTISRSWHLHPLAVLKDRDLKFEGTIDSDLCECFLPSEIHVVTERNELAMAEISPMTKRLPLLPNGMDHDYISWWATKHAKPRHREFFKKRIVIEGSADTDCDAAADDILRLLELREAA